MSGEMSTIDAYITLSPFTTVTAVWQFEVMTAENRSYFKQTKILIKEH